MKPSQRPIATLIAFGAILAPLVFAASAADELTIEVVGGEGAINYVKSRTSREVIVRVTDTNRKPVGGATVTFAVPNHGASATFVDGSKFVTTTTDSNGQAVAAGVKANGLKGTFNINVRASFNGQTTTTSIAQTNAMAATGVASGATAAAISGKVIAIIVVAAVAGAAGGAYAVTHSGSAPKPPVSVTAGVPSFGAP